MKYPCDECDWFKKTDKPDCDKSKLCAAWKQWVTDKWKGIQAVAYKTEDDKGCEFRKVGCHSDCKDYKRFIAELNEIKEAKRQAESIVIGKYTLYRMYARALVLG